MWSDHANFESKCLKYRLIRGVIDYPGEIIALFLTLLRKHLTKQHRSPCPERNSVDVTYLMTDLHHQLSNDFCHPIELVASLVNKKLEGISPLKGYLSHTGSSGLLLAPSVTP